MRSPAADGLTEVLRRRASISEWRRSDTRPSFRKMDPWLEQNSDRRGFDEAFVPALREEFTRQLRPDFPVRIEEHIFVYELPREQ